MHWLVSICYERMRAAGLLTPQEADPIIEYWYKTLFDEYPNSRDIGYAALKLGKIHLARGEPVSACVYFNWFMDYAHAADGQIACNIATICFECEEISEVVNTTTRETCECSQ